jgi:hypothetical protein
MSWQEDPLRAAILHELFAVDETEDGEEAGSLFEDVPGIWLDEIESLGEAADLDLTADVDEPVVVLDPRIYYGDTWAPPLLDELLFGHQLAIFPMVDDAEA